MVDEALVNMATALQSYCSLTVSASTQEGDQLTITEGNVTIQLPLITDEGQSIVCTKALLVMTSDGEEVDPGGSSRCRHLQPFHRRYRLHRSRSGG